MTDTSQVIADTGTTGVRLPASPPDNSVTALSTLTKSTTDNAQVIHSPGWYDPTNSVSTGSGGTGLSLRCQQTANGGMQVSVSGTKTFGVVFDAIYPTTNDIGKQWRPKPPVIRYRRTAANSATWQAWDHGTFSHVTPAGFMLLHDLDGSSAYAIEFEASHYVAQVGASIQSEYMRDPEVVAAASEVGGFYQVSGFVTTTGATFNTLAWGTAQLKALVIGDSNSTGIVGASSGSTTIDVGNSTVDNRGATMAWWRQILDSYVSTAGMRLQLSNNSLAGAPIATMTDATRAAYIASFFDGVPSNVVDRYDAITGWTEGTTAPFTPAKRVYDGNAYVPDVVLIPMVSNDRIIASAGGDVSDFQGAKFISDIVSLIGNMQTTWPLAHIVFINTHIPDSGSVTSHADAATALGAANLDYDNDPLLHYVDLVATGTTSGGTHLTADEHDATATVLQSTFDTILDSATAGNILPPLVAAGGI